MVRRTSALGSMKCPKCGLRGQLKIQRPKLQYESKSFVMHHWKKGNNHASGFDHACYIGIANLDLAKTLYKLNHREKILKEVTIP